MGFKRSRFNWYTRVLIATIVGTALLILLLRHAEPFDLTEALKFLSDSTFVLGITILAFLAAGFTIFTTLSDRQILIELAKTDQANAGVSSFKYLFFNFISVFAVYIVGVAIALTVGLLIRLDIVAHPILCLDQDETYIAVNGLGIFIISIIVAEMLLKLKSFVWNVYSTFITLLLVSEVLNQNPKNDGSG